MTRCVPLLMVCALVAAPPAFATPGEKAPATGIATTAKDKAAKDKAAKDDAAKDKADKEKVAKEKADNEKADNADGVDTADHSATPEAAAAASHAAPAAAVATAQEERDDAVFDPAQPDFTVVTLPTTLRLPRHKSAFRVTHRFTRPLGDGSFGSLAEDFFGLDGGAQIGLEYRFGIWKGAQVGIHRTNDRTIQFFGQYDLQSQSETFPVGIAAYASIDGTQNFKDSYSPALGVVISRTIARHAAVYVAPIWVNNTNDLPSELVDDNDTFMIGVGGRLRVRGGTYVVLEVVPRATGFDPGVHQVSVGIEKRVGGHSFQMNFSNAIGTTMGQIARGGVRDPQGHQDWYLGFNITRKFF